MASFRVARRALCTAAETVTPPAPTTRWERLRNSKAGVWCRSLVSDYKEACKEIFVGAKERPLKASVYLGLVGGAWACIQTKPDRYSFQAALLDRSNQLGLLSPWIRNAASDLHVQNLVKLRNQGCLDHLSLGLFSLIYRTDFDPDSALYEARCSNVSVPWRELPDRVLDVGFVGRWWVLDTKMKDFDVNEAEFRNLPAHMQATAPPGVQEVERNERLHKESWLPLKVEEEEESGTVVVTKVDSEEVDSVSEVVDIKVDSVGEEDKNETVVNTKLEIEELDKNGTVVDTKLDFEEVDKNGTLLDIKVDSVSEEVDRNETVLDIKVDSEKVHKNGTLVDSAEVDKSVTVVDIKLDIVSEDVDKNGTVEDTKVDSEEVVQQTEEAVQQNCA